MDRIDHLGRVSAPAEPERVVIRWCGEDRQAHCYRLSQVSDPGWRVLIPCCWEDRNYPIRHDRQSVGSTDLIGPDRHDMCRVCWVWCRRQARTISVRGSLVAVGEEP